MMTPKVLSLILALQVLTTLVMYVNALPITSKPIESTAENLAWQAWLMLPPEQKNLEKSRKVTPKSIFTLPFRECPPGHHLFENRCIPTVQIDPNELLTQELLGLVGTDSDNNYGEFDYDDLGGEIVAEVMYEPAQKLSGNEDSSYNDTTYDQLPTQDEPLKFNIFQQKFPTDYESIATPSEEAEQQQQPATMTTTGKSNNSTNVPLAEAVNALVTAGSNASVQNATNTNVDLQMEGSNVSTNIAQKADDIVTPTTAFSLSDIDAIVLPATTVQRGNNGNGNGNGDADADYLETQKQNIHKFSLFKDESSVQLVTSSLLADFNKEASKQPDLKQLLKADDLLPLPNVAATKTTATTMGTTTPQHASSTTTDNEVPTLSTSFMGSATTLLGSSASSGADNAEVTDMMLSDVDATMPTIPKEIEQYNEGEKFGKKAEHPRSVIDGLESEGQESNFMTTTEAAGTTNFQLDETTIIEVHDAPTIALKELLELASSPPHPSGGASVVKKSKVEPVELPPIVETATDSTIITTAQPTTILMTPTATPSLETETETATSTATASTSTKTTDRFDNYQQRISAKTGEQQHNKDVNDKVDDKLNFSDTETTTKAALTTTTMASTATTTIKTLASTATPTATTTTKMISKTSEIDMEQELRMINELVKGNKNKNNHEKNTNQQHQHQLKAETIKSATVEAESGPATTTISALASDATTTKAVESSSTSTETTTTMQTSSTTIEPTSTSTIWSKLMPLLGFSGGSTTTSLLTDETTTHSAATAGATTPKSVSSSSAANTKSNLNTNLSNNRSNRNSKIIRINSLSSFSSSTNSKAQFESSTVSKQTADKLALSSPQSSQMATTTTTTETPTSTVIASTTTTGNAAISDDSNSSSSSSSISGGGVGNDDVGEGAETSTTTDSDSVEGEPFWWLPIGWRLDRDNEPSLLLRFWSALPGQGD